MFNYSAAILLLIKVYCALSWLYYLYLFIVYSRVHKKESRWEMGSSKDRLKPRPLLWPLDKWVAFFLFFCVCSFLHNFSVMYLFFFLMGCLLNPAPHFPFLNQTGKQCGHRHWLCCARIYCIKYYFEAANGPGEDSPIMLLA